MKLLSFVIFSVFCFAAFGQDVPAPGPTDAIASFFAKQEVWIVLGIMVWEYLIGKSKLKSNSTIDLLISFIKMMLPKKD